MTFNIIYFAKSIKQAAKKLIHDCMKIEPNKKTNLKWYEDDSIQLRLKRNKKNQLNA